MFNVQCLMKLIFPIPLTLTIHYIYYGQTEYGKRRKRKDCQDSQTLKTKLLWLVIVNARTEATHLTS